MRNCLVVFGAAALMVACSDTTNRTSLTVETDDTSASRMIYENNDYRQVVNGSAQSECAMGEDDVRECVITGTGIVTFYLQGRMVGEYTLPEEGSLTCISTPEDVICR